MTRDSFEKQLRRSAYNAGLSAARYGYPFGTDWDGAPPQSYRDGYAAGRLDREQEPHRFT